MAQIDYLTNLNLKDDKAREQEYLKMLHHFGYIPVFGPNMAAITQGKIVLGHLLRKYPGYRWVLEVRGGVVRCVNEDLGHNWGFTVHEHLLDGEGVLVRNLAGQLLEQYNVRRGPKNDQEIDEAKKNPRGELIREG